MDFHVAGNKALQARNYSEAIEQFTAALANSNSWQFSAKCLCSRAAAYQFQDRILDAIQDCNFAISINPNFVEALVRRSKLYELARNFMEAANDSAKFVSLLEERQQNAAASPELHEIRMPTDTSLTIARERVSVLEKKAGKSTPLDMYLILGVEKTCSEVDVKSSYRRAALRHHPDKVCYYLKRNNNFNEEAWRKVVKDVLLEADKLFKMIGAAYAVLSDTNKRLQYDVEEGMRSMSMMRTTPWGTRCTPQHSWTNASASPRPYYNNRAWKRKNGFY